MKGENNGKRSEFRNVGEDSTKGNTAPSKSIDRKLGNPGGKALVIRSESNRRWSGGGKFVKVCLSRAS